MIHALHDLKLVLVFYRVLFYVKETAYKGLIWPILEYASKVRVWDPYHSSIQDELKKVHNLAAHFLTSDYSFEPGSMSNIIESLGWKSLWQPRKEARLVFTYKGKKGKANIPFPDYPTIHRKSRTQHESLLLIFHMPGQTFISSVSFPTLSEIGIPYQY